MKKFLGIDQSYTSAGYCVIDETGNIVEFGTIRTTEDKEGDVFDRAAHVTAQSIALITKHDPARLGLEGLAFSKFGNATRDLAGLQFVMITQFREKTNCGKDMVIVSPNLLKKFASGKGGASKQEMAEALPADVLAKFTDAKYKKTTGLYDVTDAYWIANYTLAEYKKSQKTP